MSDELRGAEELAEAGWVVECISPFEIRHADGSFASGQAAIYVRNAIVEEHLVWKASTAKNRP